MSYSVYTTPAFVLSTRNIGEANRLYTLLTRDVGTISATAQSVRLEKSKLRYALQNFSFAEVSLVRGKGGWRITNAYSLGNLFFEITEKSKRDLLAKIFRLLKRLLVGESPDVELFEIIRAGFSLIQTLPSSEIPAFELVFVLRIISALGYGTDSKILEEFSREPLESETLRKLATENRREIIKEINTALRASGL